MKKCTLIIVFICAYLLSLSTDASPISFKKALQLAFTYDPTLHEVKAKLHESTALLSHERASNLPSLKLDINGQQSDNALNVFSYKLSQRETVFSDFGFEQYTGPSSANIKPERLNYPGYYSNVDTGFVLNIPIFSGLSGVENIKAAHHLVNANIANLAQAKEMLIYRILQAYDAYIIATRIEQDAKDACDAATQLTKMTRSLRKQSTVMNADVLLAQTNARSQQSTLKIARLQKQTALNTFRVLIGKPHSQLTPQKWQSILLPSISNKSSENVLFSSNLTLQALESTQKAKMANVNAARGTYLPQINLQLRHDWNDESLSFSHPSNTAILSLDWSLLNFGIQRSVTQEAVAKLEATHAAISNEQDQLRQQATQLSEAITTSTIKLQVTEKNIPLLKQIIKEYKNRYGRGYLTLGQVLTVQNQLDNAKIQRDFAQYQLLMDKARMLILFNKLKT